jgi:hypothetical protein
VRRMALAEPVSTIPCLVHNCVSTPIADPLNGMIGMFLNGGASCSLRAGSSMVELLALGRTRLAGAELGRRVR